MPFKWASPCLTPGCPNKARHGTKCDACRSAAARVREERRPSASGRGYGGDWRKHRDRQVDRQPYCGQCGTTENLVADHMVPIRHGGTHDDANLQTLCTRCNAIKRERDRGVFA